MSYWGSEGKYQAQKDQIEQDVPAEGYAQNVAVELYRCAANVYYEIFNNGGCNMGMDASDDRFHEHSRNQNLSHIASYGIDTSKIDELVEKMVEEYERESDMIEYDNSESEAMVGELWKDGGFMDEMMNSVIEKCKDLGYEFKEDLED